MSLEQFNPQSEDTTLETAEYSAENFMEFYRTEQEKLENLISDIEQHITNKKQASYIHNELTEAFTSEDTEMTREESGKKLTNLFLLGQLLSSLDGKSSLVQESLVAAQEKIHSLRKKITTYQSILEAKDAPINN